MKLKIITIDGPSASGKGSLSRNLAKYLDFNIFASLRNLKSINARFGLIGLALK